MSARQTVFTFAFVANSALICACSILYCIEWTDFNSPCGESQAVITVICGMAAVLFGGMTIAAVLFYCCLMDGNCSRFGRLMTVLLTLSAGSLIFSVVAGSGMLVSLYFGYDPSCLANSKSKTDFVLLWSMAFYAVVSNAVFLFVLTCFSFEKEAEEPVKILDGPKV